MNKPTWTKVDTASIMFTSLTTRNWGRTFAFTVVMKDEIDPTALRAAAADVLPCYPSTCTDLRSGFFWSYQVVVDTAPEIRPAPVRPLTPITSRQRGLPNLRFVYAGKTVTL